MTSDVIKQSIRFTNVYRVMIRPLSGGLECVTSLFAWPYLDRYYFMLSVIRGGVSIT